VVEAPVSDLEDMIRKIVRDELAKQPANEDAPEYVTVAEYARARSISDGTVHTAIREKRLPSIKIGRARRVPAKVEIKPRAASQDDATERARLVLLGGGKR
jgi:excisionase family DNA binding protein